MQSTDERWTGDVLVRSPTGVQWRVYVWRWKRPHWREAYFDDKPAVGDGLVWAALDLLGMIVIPLLEVVIATPFLLVHGLFRRQRTVGAQRSDGGTRRFEIDVPRKDAAAIAHRIVNLISTGRFPPSAESDHAFSTRLASTDRPDLR